MLYSSNTSPPSDITDGGPLTYEDALALVMGLADFERSSHTPRHSSFHLERISLLLHYLENPHLGIPTVHIAGTKGKGSTAAMVTSILTSQGYKVGLYTSPHLHSAVERIRIGLEAINREAFADLVEQIWPAVERVGNEGGYGAISTFEMLTAMAFLHFKRTAVDFQVIEVGLGGKLDATNIVSPEVCAITHISLDHVATLGDTVQLIAAEKAGIIKPGIPVIVAPQFDDALRVIREIGVKKGSHIISIDEQATWRKRRTDIQGQSFDVVGLLDHYSLTTPLLGDHQLENAVTAIVTIETLIGRGFPVDKANILQGLRDVRWSARFEVMVHNEKLVVVDGAHNPHSMSRLVQSVRDLFTFQRLILIFGALGGHNAREMIEVLADLSPSVLPVQSRHPRSSPDCEISRIVAECGLNVLSQPGSVAEAMRLAIKLAGDRDLILATGSLSVAAEILEEMKDIDPELYPYIKRPKTSTSS